MEIIAKRDVENSIPYIQYNECEITKDPKDENKTITKVIKEGEKIFLYEIREDGNKMQFKIANFMHPDNVKQHGLVEVVIKERSKRNEPAFDIPKVQDPVTGIIYGDIISVDPKTKEFIFRVVKLVEGQVFDMNSILDKKSWMQVQRHHAVEGSPFASNHKSYFKVKDKEADARAKVIKVKARSRAIDIISNLNHGKLVDMAINVGEINNHDSEETLRADLYSWVEKEVGGVANATKFCEIYDNDNREVVTIFKRCYVTGLITFDVHTGFLWETGVKLGDSEAAVINYMNKNISLLTTMDHKSKSANGMFQKFSTEKEKQSLISKSERVEVPAKEEFLSSADLTRKMGQVDDRLRDLDEMKKQLADTLAEMKKDKEDNKPTPPVESVIKKVTVDTISLEELEKLAKNYGLTDQEISASTKEGLFNFVAKKKKAEKNKQNEKTS